MENSTIWLEIPERKHKKELKIMMSKGKKGEKELKKKDVHIDKLTKKDNDFEAVRIKERKVLRNRGFYIHREWLMQIEILLNKSFLIKIKTICCLTSFWT